MISVAMITMNEEKAVGRVIEDIRAALAGREHEIVIVDRAATPRPTLPRAWARASYANSLPKATAVPWAGCCGNRRGDVVVTLDCDGTYPAAEIPRIADRVLSGECDLVNASRLEQRPETMPFANYMANWLFAVTGWLLVGVKSTDLHSGMRAYSRAKSLSRWSSIRTVRLYRWNCC